MIEALAFAVVLAAGLFLRVPGGGAFVFCTPRMLLPGVFSVFGWLLPATTAGLLFVPWRWHHRLARRTVPQAIRFLLLVGVSSVVVGGAILAAACVRWMVAQAGAEWQRGGP